MKKKIGDLYEKEKFNKAFDETADRLVSNVMGEFASTEKGMQAKIEAVSNLKKRIGNIPTAFYKILEAYIDGEDITRYARVSDGDEKLELLINRKDSGLIDLVGLISNGKLEVNDVAEAEAYYEKKARLLFSPSKKNADLAKEIIKAPSWQEETKKRLYSFDMEKKRIQHLHKINQQEIRKEHAAFINEKKDIGKHDSANKLLKSLYSEFKREHKTLVKMENLVMSLKRRLIPLDVMKEYGVISDNKLKLRQKLYSRKESATRDMECYMNALDELNEVRYKNGIISKELYLKRGGNTADGSEGVAREQESQSTRLALVLDKSKAPKVRTREDTLSLHKDEEIER